MKVCRQVSSEQNKINSMSPSQKLKNYSVLKNSNLRVLWEGSGEQR